MKNTTTKILLAGLTAGWFAAAGIALAQDDATPPPPGAAAAPPDQVVTPPPDQGATNAATGTNATTVDATPTGPEGSHGAATAGVADKGLIINFRGAPVDTVLKYLADSAGFTITRDVDTRNGGTVDMQSSTPLGKDEIVALLNMVLARNGLTAIQDGNNLEIETVETAIQDAKTPVVYWHQDYKEIPSDATVVTEIIPLHSLNPTQVIKDLYSLRPPDAEMAANEGGNAIIMTAKRADIRRFTQIIQALDSSGDGDLKVFLLTYADSKSIADELKEVFSPPDAANQNQNPFAMFSRGRGGFGGGGATAAEDNPKRATIRVNAVSDDENNAVLVSAPVDIMPFISNIITQLDIPQEDQVVIRVFHLLHSDPTDIANELAVIFPDPNSTAQQTGNRGQRGAFQFGVGGRGGFGGFGGAAASTAQSSRLRKQTTVYSTPDARTQSIIVTASKDTMEQIEKMVLELDSNAARTVHVYVYKPQYADVLDMQTPLSDLFSSTSHTSSTSSQANALLQRQTQAAQQNTITTSSASSGIGGSGSGRSSGP